MDELPKLLPCPFCGSEAKQRTSFGTFYIECTVCPAETNEGAGSWDWEAGKARCIDNWNKRVKNG